jgi:hypothetical protein
MCCFVRDPTFVRSRKQEQPRHGFRTFLVEATPAPHFHHFASVRAFTVCAANTPFADFCHLVRSDLSLLSLESETAGRSPEVSSTAGNAQPLDLHAVPLMDRASLPLANSPEHCLARIQFLFIGSRLCSTLLSDLTSRLGPCASLSLHLHLAVKRTAKLSSMLGTPKEERAARAARSSRLGLLLFLPLPRPTTVWRVSWVLAWLPASRLSCFPHRCG